MPYDAMTNDELHTEKRCKEDALQEIKSAPELFDPSLVEQVC